MYTLGVDKSFSAIHFLVGGDWGPENRQHAHSYRLELRLEGGDLDRDGFVVDIARLDVEMERQISRFRNKVLNDLPEFSGLNPSIENFARIFFQGLQHSLHSERITGLSVKVWEDDKAWVEYRED